MASFIQSIPLFWDFFAWLPYFETPWHPIPSWGGRAWDCSRVQQILPSVNQQFTVDAHSRLINDTVYVDGSLVLASE